VCAAIYLRISRDQTGEGLAVERQQEDCERLARERGWTVVETYTDSSISAYVKTRKRPAYDRLVADFQAGRFSALVCWDLDRLTRQPRQLEDWIDAAEERGLRLVTANGEADLSTDGGRLYARIKAAVARGEMERKGARQTRAHIQRAALGRPPRGVRATGYTLNGEVIPEEAAAVAAMFQAFAAGASLKAIATALNGAEPPRGPGLTLVQDVPRMVPALPSRTGRPWGFSSVQGILRNPRYAGWSMLHREIVRTVTGEPVQAGWEPLVSDVLWLQVQAKLDDPNRKTNRIGTARKHLGAGLYLCGICDGKVRTHGARYRCAGHIMRSREPIDRHVLHIIRARLEVGDVTDLLGAPDDARAAELREGLHQQRGRIARARADYDSELIDGALYRDIKTDAETKISALEAERLTMSGSECASVLLAADPVAAFDHAGLSVQRALIDALCVVRLHHHPRGRKAFDSTTVQVTPRR